MYSRAGIGMSDASQIVQISGQTAAGVVPGILASGAASSLAAGGSGLILGMAPALAVPVIGAAIMGVTLAIGLFMNRMGPKQKVFTTKIVDEAEPLLKQNLAAWQASDKTRSEQIQSLQNFDNVWASVVAACDKTELGNPGQACINDRKPGGQWDWASYYRTPILNDPDVQPDPTVTDEVGAAFSSLGISGGGSIVPWLIGGALLFALSK